MTGFDEALARALARRGENRSIGTLGERTLHAALKYYYAPDESRHEVRVGKYVADIAAPEGVIEIQTRAFHRLRGKLTAFLAAGDVTVVYPVAQVKWLCWIDPETGETTKRRRSPKTGRAADILYELYAIRPLLQNPRLHLRVALLEIEEYRLLNGWSRDGKRGSTRSERIPLAFLGEERLDGSAGYDRLLPGGLPERFTSRDFAKASRYSPDTARTALLVLSDVGAVRRVGKNGNQILYETAKAPRPEAQVSG